LFDTHKKDKNLSDMNKIYESYYYRELRNSRKPIEEKEYLKERLKGNKRKDGTYNAPTFIERLGYPRFLIPFFVNGSLDKEILEKEIIHLSNILDNHVSDRSCRKHYENRLEKLLEFI